MALTKESLTKNGLQIKEIKFKTLGDTGHLKELNGLQISQMSTYHDQNDAAGLNAYLIMVSLCSSDGKRIFGTKDEVLGFLENSKYDVMAEMIKAIMDFNKLGSVEEQAVKN